MKKLNNIKMKLTAKALTAIQSMKASLKDNRGSVTVEYVIILILVVVVGALLIPKYRTEILGLVDTASTKMNAMFN